MKNKIVSIVLSVLLIISVSTVAFAQQPKDYTLKFDENGEFTIMNICDMQDKYPASEAMLEFVREAIDKYNPDIVVLGGDNTVGSAETKAQAIKEICDLFIEKETYFTLVFGNHDAEQGVDRETLFDYYLTYGGEYCLAYDAVEELTGVGTHNLPVLSSDGSKTAFNLWMFDSNMYSYDENGVELGYDCVHEDQINWYKQTAAQLAEANGGEVVPAMAFQHIIVQEIYDALFVETAEQLAFRKFDGKSFSFMPKVFNIDDGLLLEAPCPGYYNYGQFDAFLETGDVMATFAGHDHVNSFTVNYKGIDIVTTPGSTFNSYGKSVNRGCRVLTVHENDPWNYDSELVTIAQTSLDKESKISDYGYSAFDGFFGVIGTKLLNAFVWTVRYSMYAFRLLDKVA